MLLVNKLKGKLNVEPLVLKYKYKDGTLRSKNSQYSMPIVYSRVIKSLFL